MTPTVAELMEAVPGLGKKGAYRRLWRLRRGELAQEDLYLPPRAKTGIGNAGLPTVAELMEAVPGLGKNGAAGRLRRCRAGRITIAKLFAPMQGAGDGLPTAAKIMEAAPGLSRRGANIRLTRYRAGRITIAKLFAPARAWRHRKTSNRGTPEWQALGCRVRLENMPELGTWERQEVGR